MREQTLFTAEGYKARTELKKLGIEEEEAERIIKDLDNRLSRQNEIVRQYRACFGESHDWQNTLKEKLRIAKEVLEIAEENSSLLDYHNL